MLGEREIKKIISNILKLKATTNVGGGSKVKAKEESKAKILNFVDNKLEK